MAEIESMSPREKSKRIRLHKGFRPKHQYCYHRFKARMKLKKKHKFRKPKPLFHLTFWGRMLIVFVLFTIRAQSAYNNLATIIRKSFRVTIQLHHYFLPCQFGRVLRAKHWLHLWLARVHDIFDQLYFKLMEIAVHHGCERSLFRPDGAPTTEPCINHVCFQGETMSDSAIQCSCFDTDSFEIGIDTQCSRTMSGDKSHF